MDFRIPGLPHSVVKHAQSTSVRQLIQKIENHPDRHAFQQDLRQNQSFNPFSPQSRIKTNDSGRWEHRIMSITRDGTQNAVHSVYHTGTLVYSAARAVISCIKRGANQQFISYTMDLLSLPEYVIKKGRPHGHRYGKKPRDKEYFTANQLKKRCKKKYFQGIHDRFIRDPEFRSRMIEIIEMKNFVDDGMLLRMKITLII